MESKIGIKIPDFKALNLLNGKSPKLNLDIYKDRLLILDFWATTCSGCVAALPKMEELQKKFGQKLKILPVTFESASIVSPFLKNNKYTKNLAIASVVNDKILHNYFKHASMPHEVWIYKGKTIAVTTADYVDQHNIEKVISGDEIDWPVKYDYYVFDRSKSLFKLDEKQIDTSTTDFSYSAISDYKEGVNSEGLSGGMGINKNEVNKTIRAYFLNQPIFNSYLTLLNYTVKPDSLVKPQILFSPNQIIWEVADRSWYTHEKEFGYQQNWIREHGICFESVQVDKGQTDQQVYRSIINDMNGLLGLNVRWEKRDLDVLILTKKETIEHSDKITGTKIRRSNLVYELNQYASNPYIFDETKEGEKEIDINISDWTNIPEIQRQLNLIGYELKKEKKLVDKLVFTEVDGGLLIDPKMQAEIKKRKDAQKDLHNPESADNLNFLNRNKLNADVYTLPSGLQYKIIKMGNGSIADSISRVSVNYTGMLVNGRIFDSSLENGKPAVLKFADVIAGWQDALKLMPAGSKWILYIPANLAYADHTAGGMVPPNSTLIFEIELLQILSSTKSK
ncbi:FKBP-type peptidyl-prolyl cis-trans isomerase [Pedobacter sp. MR2016-24]|uniref:FKBP-type peptidyl-prolyl cis-trans isomerase n=1 Tax=Pedobacter sp. MR2016-24 TaxID=2994466 RepID=UPI0022484F9C|nr:FKBP-type peptidyl-prolyl cis-trans isomerase [Pedobacter sp. MR2016-24]MCX2483388.1 FKBP-type peptidyl-prolyl cis-trans isomerase [Pedobacter sp. MR2016-24]